jgi:hypothetical protein
MRLATEHKIATEHMDSAFGGIQAGWPFTRYDTQYYKPFECEIIAFYAPCYLLLLLCNSSAVDIALLAAQRVLSSSAS